MDNKLGSHKDSHWLANLNEAKRVLEDFLADPSQIRRCQEVAALIIRAFQDGHNVFSAGNGGSHCDAMHFAEECTGRYRKNRRPLGALALGDSSHLTCVSNDYGFKYVFSRQLEALARKGDVLLALSTSGQSENLIEAIMTAKKKGVHSIALLGRDGGKMKDLADLSIVVPAQTSDRIQEIHIKIVHSVVESVERELFPENYN